MNKQSQTVLEYEMKMMYMEDVNNNRTKAQIKSTQAENNAQLIRAEGQTSKSAIV
jgi:hypothetical protein